MITSLAGQKTNNITVSDSVGTPPCIATMENNID